MEDFLESLELELPGLLLQLLLLLMLLFPQRNLVRARFLIAVVTCCSCGLVFS